MFVPSGPAGRPGDPDNPDLVPAPGNARVPLPESRPRHISCGSVRLPCRSDTEPALTFKTRDSKLGDPGSSFRSGLIRGGDGSRDSHGAVLLFVLVLPANVSFVAAAEYEPHEEGGYAHHRYEERNFGSPIVQVTVEQPRASQHGSDRERK